MHRPFHPQPEKGPRFSRDRRSSRGPANPLFSGTVPLSIRRWWQGRCAAWRSLRPTSRPSPNRPSATGTPASLYPLRRRSRQSSSRSLRFACEELALPTWPFDAVGPRGSNSTLRQTNIRGWEESIPFLPLGLICHEDMPMLVLAGLAVDEYRSTRENGIRPCGVTLTRTVPIDLPTVGKSLRIPDGQDTPPRNAA